MNLINHLAKLGLTLALAVTLAACNDSGSAIGAGGSGAGQGSGVVPADAPGHENIVPASPAMGEPRAGQSYSIYIEVPATGDVLAFTVHEPAEMVSGEKYPLVLYGHGGGEQRVTNPNDPATSNQPINNPKQYIQNGYGVISMDLRGHGESSGTIRLLDPDFEGLALLAMLDWAEAKLDWLAYGPSVDGSDPHNLMLGAIGASYGGAFQMLIHDIDPKHRLDAIIPEATWYDVNSSIAPNGVNKTIWSLFLFGRLSTASNNPDPSRVDPFVQSLMLDGLLTNQINQEQRDFLTYHSNSYFCAGQALATTAGAAIAPLFQPQQPGKIHALFMQGMRDTLFNFNQAYANYDCYRQAGGDVRLRSYHFGHNATPVVLDPGIKPVAPNPDPEAFTPPFDAYDNHCGSLSGHDAGLAFFDEHLKGIAGAADIIPTQVCISLTAEDGVLVDEVTTGHAGTEVDVPSTNVIAAVPELPIVVELGVTAGPEGDVLAGIPRLEVTLEALAEILPGDPIIFAGIGLKRAPLPGLPLPLVWELVDNQIMPLRGLGDHSIDLAGIGERLQPGDQVALLLYGGHSQYLINGSINLAQPNLTPLTVQGKLWLPMLGSPTAAP